MQQLNTVDSFEFQREPQLRDYLAVVWRHKVMIILLVVIATGLGAAYIAIKIPLYRAAISLRLNPQTNATVPQLDRSQTATSPDFKTFYKTQYEIIRSRATAERVVQALTPAEQQKLITPHGLMASLGHAPDFSDISPDKRARMATRRVQDDLTLNAPSDTQIVNVSFDSPDPKLSAHVANLIGQAYIGLERTSREQEAKSSSRWLTQQLGSLRNNLNKSELALQQFKQKNGLLNSKDMESLNNKQLSTISQQLLDARSKRIQAQSLYQQASKVRKSHGGYASLASVLNDPVIQQLRLKQSDAQRHLNSLSQYYGAKAEQVQQARAQLAQTTGKLHAETRNIVRSLKRQYQAALVREQKLEEEEQSTQSGMRDQGSKRFELEKLERNVAMNRDLYEMFRNRIKDTGLQSQSNATVGQMLDAAQVPTSAFSPSRVRVFGAAWLISLFLGIVLSFLRENMSHTFRTPREMESQLQLPGLGVLPMIGSRKKNLLRQVSGEPQSPFADALGEIRSRLEVTDLQNPPQVLMVTSALPGEGKSTLSSNLAEAYSQKGRTLLLDADLRRAGLRTLGKKRGFTDFAWGGISLQSCCALVESTPNLYVMSTGDVQVNPLQFLSSQAIDAVFQRLRKEFQTIVIDTPPICAVADAFTLGRYVDGVILTVQASSTPSDVVTDALRRLRAANLRIFGVVLSKARPREMARYGNPYIAYGNY